MFTTYLNTLGLSFDHFLQRNVKSNITKSHRFKHGMLATFLASFSDVLPLFLQQILYRERFRTCHNCPPCLNQTFLPIYFVFLPHACGFCMASGHTLYNFLCILIKTRIIENWLLSKALDRLIVLFENENIYLLLIFSPCKQLDCNSITETGFSGYFSLIYLGLDTKSRIFLGFLRNKKIFRNFGDF